MSLFSVDTLHPGIDGATADHIVTTYSPTIETKTVQPESSEEENLGEEFDLYEVLLDFEKGSH
jgi:hypothetical protein